MEEKKEESYLSKLQAMQIKELTSVGFTEEQSEVLLDLMSRKAMGEDFFRANQKTMNQKEEKELRKRFEHNLLDGDDLDDCGNAMLSAKEVFEYFSEELKSHDAEMRKKLVKYIGFTDKCPYRDCPKVHYHECLIHGSNPKGN